MFKPQTFTRVLIFSVLLFLIPYEVFAKQLNRQILAIYDLPPDALQRKKALTKEEFITSLGSYYSLFHRHAEMPLNHLGMDVTYHYVEDPLPKLDELRQYRAIMTWLEFPHSIKNPSSYCGRLNQALNSGVKIIVLGETGLPNKIDSHASCQALFRNMGVEQRPPIWIEPLFVDVTNKDPSLTEFERKLDPTEINEFPIVHPIKSAESYLTVRSTEDPRLWSSPVFTTKKGAMALNPFLFYRNINLKPTQIRWRINPFDFFEKALHLENKPRPDTTTINGKRIYYSHVDGDGIFNISEVDNKSWSGKIFLEEILKKYTQLPFTISLITAYYDLNRYNTREAFQLGEELLNLAHVEPASHGYSHPFNWARGEVAVPIKNHIFSPEKEIHGSLNFINQTFLGKAPQANLFLWTGDCLPTLPQLRVARSKGLLNMNGGDTRLDRFFNSYAYVFPLGRKIGSLRQIYSSNSNENTYTNLWEGPFYGFRDVIETFKRTDHPIRIKPINIYLHFYSAEKLAALHVLKKVYDWVLSQSLYPLFAGEYAQLVDDFFAMSIEEKSPTHFIFKNGQNLRTIRFDKTDLIPDLTRSKGVLGFKRENKILYVYLKKGVTREIVLSKKRPTVPYLIESNFKVTDWAFKNGRLRFKKEGWWKGHIRLGGLVPRKTYRFHFDGGEYTWHANNKGELDIPFQANGATHLIHMEPTS